MLSKIFVVGCMVASVICAPSSLNARAADSSVSYLDTYDTLDPGLPVSGVQNPVGNYHGLQYQGWFVGGPALPLVNDANGGILPQSPHNQAIGTPQLNLTLNTITVNYSGSPYSKFDLFYFYFGCSSATQQGLVSVAQGCVIEVNGYYPDGNQTGVATYGFSATNPAASYMMKAVLPLSFLGLKTVTFGIASSATTIITTNVQVDNLAHKNWK